MAGQVNEEGLRQRRTQVLEVVKKVFGRGRLREVEVMGGFQKEVRHLVGFMLNVYERVKQVKVDDNKWNLSTNDTPTKDTETRDIEVLDTSINLDVKNEKPTSFRNTILIFSKSI